MDLIVSVPEFSYLLCASVMKIVGESKIKQKKYPDRELSHEYLNLERREPVKLIKQCTNCLTYLKKVRENPRECHDHKPKPFPDTKRKRKQTKPNKRKSNKRTKSTKISSLPQTRKSKCSKD